MTLFLLAFVAGLLTIATPCIFPVLPFVLARGEEPFEQGGLPMLVGMAMAFAAVASLASVAGEWAVDANSYARVAALALMTLFGLTLLIPTLAEHLTAPVVSIGSGLSRWAGLRTRAGRATAGSSMLLGVATGLVWAPCAGPILGLILAGAALRGPSVETSLLLVTYGVGASTSLAVGLFFGRRLLAVARRFLPWGDGLRRILGGAVVAGAATIWLGLDVGLLSRLSAAGPNMLEQRFLTLLRYDAELTTTPRDSLFEGAQWLNTRPLHSDDLRGKVVLVNFWTYSCIDCVRSLPHLRSWSEKYKDRGLVIIGVHTPEFAFEKNTANVRGATVSLGISYPVVIDNDLRIWRAFNNRAWPAFYFIGTDGRIRDRVFGDGNYDESERLIQQLLLEAL